MKRIIVTVAPDGQTTVGAEGFLGNQCRDATAQLREALGQPLNEQLSSAYFQMQTAAPQEQENRI